MISHVGCASTTHDHHQIFLSGDGGYISAKECADAPHSGDDDFVQDRVQSAIFDDFESVVGGGEKRFAVDGDFAEDQWGDGLKDFVDIV